MIGRIIRRLLSSFGGGRSRRTPARRRRGGAESQLAKGAVRTARKHLK